VAAPGRACGRADHSTRAVPGTGSVPALRPATRPPDPSVSSTSHSRRERGPATPGGLRWHWAGPRCQGGPRSTSPAVTTQLDQPRPDLIRRRVDRNGHRRRPLAVGDELGTGIRPGDLLIGCAPAHEPRTHPSRIDDSRRPGHANDLASNRLARQLRLRGHRFPNDHLHQIAQSVGLAPGRRRDPAVNGSTGEPPALGRISGDGGR
jgi:hypothetical protein